MRVTGNISIQGIAYLDLKVEMFSSWLKFKTFIDRLMLLNIDWVY